MNILLLDAINFHQYINFYLLLIIPWYLSVVIEDQWIKRNIIVIENIKEPLVAELIGRKIFFGIFNGFSTVITYKILFYLDVPIVSKAFLSSFIFISALWVLYLLFIRIKFKS
ncbi:MAG: hypothetical protein AAGA80_08715 [Cyanobacteria bacterium P01_F01_bin.143]